MLAHIGCKIRCLIQLHLRWSGEVLPLYLPLNFGKLVTCAVAISPYQDACKVGVPAEYIDEDCGSNRHTKQQMHL